MTRQPACHHAVTADDAPAIWFSGTLATIKAAGDQTGGRLAVVEFLCPPGFATPRHVHHAEDEAFVVLEGSLSGFCGESAWAGSPGSLVWLPRDVEHGFSVDPGGTARIVAITTPAGFERFVTEAGVPAERRTLPPDGPPDIERLIAAAAQHGQEILGPPPG
ncbi:MAG: cupin domain-containing protein [Chloroflexi bacterium]|nr:cupin domain-containing protein [Chloroflexota bacterium]